MTSNAGVASLFLLVCGVFVLCYFLVQNEGLKDVEEQREKEGS